MISINLFFCCKKCFTHANTGMIGKNSLEHYYKRKKIFTVSLNMEDVTDADYMHAITISKDFKTKRN